MLSVKDVAIVYQTLLSSPGMNDAVKIALHIPRRNVLLLGKIMEMGVNVKDDAHVSLLNAVNKDWVNELTAIMRDVLEKGGLTEMNEKLLALETK